MAEWLIEDVATEAHVQTAAVTFEQAGRNPLRAESPRPPLAVRLHDLVVHNNKKWFSLLGGADIRVDAVVVQGNVLDGNPTSAYAPATMRFPDVGDGDSLSDDEHGLLIFYGRPRHFLDISVMVSRDRKDSDDLADLIHGASTSPELQKASAALLGLTALAPQAAALELAVAAAATIGNLAYRLVRQISGNTIGFYRGNRLEHPDRFGKGRNPAGAGVYQKGDISFWYEVVAAAKSGKR